MSEPTIRCGRCGAANEPNARFCANCGATLPETAVGVSIPLPTATRVVRLTPGAGGAAAPPKPSRATAGVLLLRALIALVIGVVLVFVNRLDPTGTAGIFALLAWYIAVICVVLAVVRGLVFRRA
ncbi:MAG TPA: zinc ribbon domain-containing protein [Thermomicrobiales bacterium]|nr:zinc ribbon domain-containing protein [Thermomicrobiales bacterium]